MSYQGHLPDGSSVQKHSAGSCYPFIVYGQETTKGLKFGIISPNGRQTGAYLSCARACEVADAWAETMRKHNAAKAALRAAAAEDRRLMAYVAAYGV